MAQFIFTSVETQEWYTQLKKKEIFRKKENLFICFDSVRLNGCVLYCVYTDTLLENFVSTKIAQVKTYSIVIWMK